MKPMFLLSLVLAFGVAGRAGPPPPGHGVHFIYLVRHGSYDRDPKAHDDRVANGLNQRGHEQAKLTGRRLSELHVHFDRLISSELLRAKQTADDMGAVMHMTPSRDASLNECSPTSVDAGLLAREGPERAAACDRARALQWVRYFNATPAHDTHDVLVSHGNVIRWELLRTLGADTKLWPLLDIGNCSLTVVAVWPDGTPSLVSFDDVGHLPPALQTFTGRGVGAR